MLSLGRERPRLRICRSSGAPPQVSTYFRTRQVGGSSIQDLASVLSKTGQGLPIGN